MDKINRSVPASITPRCTPKVCQSSILGIDPGSKYLGYALINATTANPIKFSDFSIQESGILNPPSSLSFTSKLGYISQKIIDLISRLNPDTCVLEKAFFGINHSTALKLGEIRGSIIAGINLSPNGEKLEINELSPAFVKKTITGNGRASKSDIAFSLNALTKNISGSKDYQQCTADECDALAIAFSYGMSLTYKN